MRDMAANRMGKELRLMPRSPATGTSGRMLYVLGAGWQLEEGGGIVDAQMRRL